MSLKSIFNLITNIKGYNCLVREEDYPLLPKEINLYTTKNQDC